MESTNFIYNRKVTENSPICDNCAMYYESAQYTGFLEYTEQRNMKPTIQCILPILSTDQIMEKTSTKGF